jgi:hypothetical protein
MITLEEFRSLQEGDYLMRNGGYFDIVREVYRGDDLEFAVQLDNLQWVPESDRDEHEWVSTTRKDDVQ